VVSFANELGWFRGERGFAILQCFNANSPLCGKK
jgi:hypothetical protein